MRRGSEDVKRERLLVVKGRFQNRETKDSSKKNHMKAEGEPPTQRKNCKNDNDDEAKRTEDMRSKGGGRLKHCIVDGDVPLCLRRNMRDSKEACDDETREMMRQIFNEIIERNNFTPNKYKKVKIKVIHKKGDVEDVSNYRPICSLPAMYKLFSTKLYGRLYPMLDQNQAEDQAGFRKIYQTTDHLATYRMMEQKCQEWGIKMWTATVDFTKAFDSISHNSIWDALKSCNVGNEYVSLLRKIYKDQKASVQTDEESESVDIQKGSKQGDPMSSLLFNTVLQYSLRDDIRRWQKKKGLLTT